MRQKFCNQIYVSGSDFKKSQSQSAIACQLMFSLFAILLLQHQYPPCNLPSHPTLFERQINRQRKLRREWEITHLVLGVAAGLEEWCSHANHIGGGHIGKVSQNFTHANHLAHPLLVSFVLESLLL